MNSLMTVIKEHIACKSQLFKLAKSDILRTYRGAALGWFWAILKPGFTIFVYWFVFEIGLRVGRDIGADIPFYLWLLAGIVPWFYMSEMLTQGMGSIKRYGYLVTKMKFPVSTIPTFVSLSKAFVNAMLILIVIIIFWVMGYPPNIYYLQIPFYFMLTFMFFTMYALFAAPLSAISKDFSNFIKSLITAVFWLSGIIWDSERINNELVKRIMMFNPVNFLCTGFRDALVYQRWFFDQERYLNFITFAGMMLLMFALALFVYKKTRKEIPDVL
ncbi:MAG: ABC transporter permease [Oscillospiraceae bacterium]|nr:ABC transporter permease [Oscillospiraceae bacterium]